MGNYVNKVLEFIRANNLTPGQVSEIDVRHDDWCALLVQGRPCDCDPQITWTPPERRVLPPEDA